MLQIILESSLRCFQSVRLFEVSVYCAPIHLQNTKSNFLVHMSWIRTMKMRFLDWIKKLLLLLALFSITVSCTPIPKTDADLTDTGVDGLNGQALINLGKKLNNPELTIIGMSINEFHKCTEWTHWTRCNAKPGNFGTRSRQRKCRENSEIMENEVELTLENDLGLCEGFCPSDYNFTQNEFCLKISEMKKNHKNAKEQCAQDGGHLINIDSDKKHQDVKAMLKGFRKNVIIDGEREDLKSPWKFSYGLQKRYVEWASGQPDNQTVSLCLILDLNDPRRLHDIDCGAIYVFLCEIPKS